MAETDIWISRIHFPVTVLGPGKRLGIWLQGCTLQCPGCMAKDTWHINVEQSEATFKLLHNDARWALFSADGGSRITVNKLVELCQQLGTPGLEGITISGGEPFQQPEALFSLLKKLRNWTDELKQPVDYLCYSGYPYETLLKKYKVIIGQLDTVIPEPFLVDEHVMPLRGSANQAIVSLTNLGKTRMNKYVETLNADKRRLLQIDYDGESLWFIGIPERNELDKIVQQCRKRGIELLSNSW